MTISEENACRERVIFISLSIVKAFFSFSAGCSRGLCLESEVAKESRSPIFVIPLHEILFGRQKGPNCESICICIKCVCVHLEQMFLSKKRNKPN